MQVLGLLMSASDGAGPSAEFVGITTQDSSSPASLAFPAGTQAGDIAIFVAGWNNYDPPNATVRCGTTGDYWTRQSYTSFNNGAWHPLTFVRVLTSGDLSAGNPTITNSSSYLMLAVYRGATGISDKGVVRYGLYGSTLKSSIDVTISLTGTCVGVVSVIAHMASGADTTWSATGWENRGRAKDPSYFNGVILDRLPGTDAASPTTFSLSPSDEAIIGWVFELTA